MLSKSTVKKYASKKIILTFKMIKCTLFSVVNFLRWEWLDYKYPVS